PGTYSVSLSATDLFDDHATNETNVTVVPSLVANFTATPLYGPAPLTVQFGVTVAGGDLPNASRTHWEFGDGTGAFGAVVSNTYSTPGFYSATGDATDQGQGNASEGFLIDVLPSGNPSTPVLTATFAPAVNISSGTTVRFTAHSNFANGSAAPAQFSWKLGENGTAWGSTVSQTYYATNGGTLRYLYATVSANWGVGGGSAEATLVSPQLLASEAGGFVPASDDLHLSVVGGPALGLPGLLWSGAAMVTGTGNGVVNWSFGDGGDSAGPLVNHTYLTPGVYTVNVSTEDGWGDGAVWASGVQIGPGVAPPLSVGGGPSLESGVAPLTVEFAANATGGAVPYSYAWETGDGGSSAITSFRYTYSVPGTYLAQLTVHDGAHGLVELNWTISVVPIPSDHSVSASSPLVAYALTGGVIAALLVGAAVLLGRRRGPATTP
ncbi:MAG: PKD domain-containing protein, partial [Thermoplasmata archaeon]|nr:PKD domain-containing protein [Thermoplasmata archaeon]